MLPLSVWRTSHPLKHKTLHTTHPHPALTYTSLTSHTHRAQQKHTLTEPMCTSAEPTSHHTRRSRSTRSHKKKTGAGTTHHSPETADVRPSFQDMFDDATTNLANATEQLHHALQSTRRPTKAPQHEAQPDITTHTGKLEPSHHRGQRGNCICHN